ncbi:MAG: hypothetical protein EB075_13850, partial [Bacteroidetes bacterium]|nr:hypothetical protein [Bacteroidota bacterium]
GGNDTVELGAGVDVITNGEGFEIVNAEHDGTNLFVTVREIVTGAQSITTVTDFATNGVANPTTRLVRTETFTNDSGQTVTEETDVEITAVLDGASSGDTVSKARVGTAFADALTASNAGDILIGGAGNDTLTGGAGEDDLIGGAGDDVLISGGNDFLEGGAGNDRYIFNGGHVEVLSGEGTDTLEIGTGFTLVDATLDLVTGDLKLSLQDGEGGAHSVKIIGHVTNPIGSIAYDADGDGIAESFSVGSGLDATTSTLNTILAGTPNDDVITGGSGDDMIFGGAGSDELYCGDGNDRLVTDGHDAVLDGGSGVDTIDFSDASGGATVDLAEALYGTPGSNAQLIAGTGFGEGGGSGNLVTVGDLPTWYLGETIGSGSAGLEYIGFAVLSDGTTYGLDYNGSTSSFPNLVTVDTSTGAVLSTGPTISSADTTLLYYNMRGFTADPATGALYG